MIDQYEWYTCLDLQKSPAEGGFGYDCSECQCRIRNCPRTRFGKNCDQMLTANADMTCEVMETVHGAVCTGCSCVRVPPECPRGVLNKNQTIWTELKDQDAQLAIMEGPDRGRPCTQAAYDAQNCGRPSSCDEMLDQHKKRGNEAYTCGRLEREFGAVCRGCACVEVPCPRNRKTDEGGRDLVILSGPNKGGQCTQAAYEAKNCDYRSLTCDQAAKLDPKYSCVHNTYELGWSCLGCACNETKCFKYPGSMFPVPQCLDRDGEDVTDTFKGRSACENKKKESGKCGGTSGGCKYGGKPGEPQPVAVPRNT